MATKVPTRRGRPVNKVAPRVTPVASAESQMSDPEPMLPQGAVEAPVSVTSEQKAAQVASVDRISRLDKMKRVLSEQPRVRVKIHNDSPVPVQLNGYTFIIQQGVHVEVPEQVAQILEDAGYL